MKHISLLIYVLLYSILIIVNGKFLFLGGAVLCLLLFFLKAISYKKNINIVSYSIRFLLIYVVCSYLISNDFTYNTLRETLLSPYLLLPYIGIIVGTLHFNYNIVSKLPILGVVVGLVYLYFLFMVKDILMSDDIMYISRNLSEEFVSFDTLSKRLIYFNFFFLFLLTFIPKRFGLFFVILEFCTFIIAIYLARRNIIFTNGVVLLFSIYSLFRNSNIPKLLRYILALLFIIVSLYLVSFIISEIPTFDNTLFSNLIRRYDSSSRSPVSEAFYNEMSTNPLYWIFGKGIISEYYCPGIEITAYRSIVETGWQHIILKIGLVGLICLLFPLCKSLFVKSSNSLILACKLYILVYLSELFVAGVPCFDVRWILLWFCVSICNSQKFLSLSNYDLKKVLCH